MENLIKKIISCTLSAALLLSANGNVFAQDGNNARAYPPEQIKAIADLQQKAKENFSAALDESAYAKVKLTTRSGLTLGAGAGILSQILKGKQYNKLAVIEVNALRQTSRQIAYGLLQEAESILSRYTDDIMRNFKNGKYRSDVAQTESLQEVDKSLSSAKEDIRALRKAGSFENIKSNPELLAKLDSYPAKINSSYEMLRGTGFRFGDTGLIFHSKELTEIAANTEGVNMLDKSYFRKAGTVGFLVFLVIAEGAGIYFTVKQNNICTKFTRQEQKLAEDNIFEVSPQAVLDDKTGQLYARLMLMADGRFVENFRNATLEELKKEIEQIQQEEKQNQEREQKQKEQSELLKNKYVPMFNNYMPETFKA